MELLEQFRQEWSDLPDLQRFLFVFLGVELLLLNKSVVKYASEMERLKWLTRS